ncbi:membrane-bound transcription factor site-2 protease homolog isoform X2 [Magnolia sinica]|uniref:membrane-bound transcription factor site-2 protease homolog isoform X2 n=1 Tax=Magnolia sinica TaxID=86752 RepID=UPI00265949B7|nr:membrane-bound transcription factor site-2 protease homolog isoform X2 [Magnolia sinica]
MAGGRWRRSARAQTLLPLRTTHLSHTTSCWYCDFKISTFNELLFSLGRKHARFLRVWFAIGVGFSIIALIGATVILLKESVGALYVHNGNASTGMLFGLSPLVPGLRISITDAGYMIISTLISIAVHEFGHAVAAASEGMHIEYIAIFLAILFPGALVAFNYELLQSLPPFTALRIYCAGIWHNAVVLSVSPKSPLSGSLSYGDLIVSLDGSHIHNPQEWIEKMVLMDDQTVKGSDNLEDSRSVQAFSSRKGYCVPSYWVEESRKVQPLDEWFACPGELMAFKSWPCLGLSLTDSIHRSDQNLTGSMHCLPAKDVVKLKKCGDGWKTTGTNSSSCPCSQDETCLSPLQKPGLTWVEITYSSPYSSKCSHPDRTLSADFENRESRSTDCGGTFVFVGDVLSEAHSVQLTAYRPRWEFNLGLHLPNMLEKMLAYTYHVSATLALLNSLPVFFLDGESIVEVILCCITWLSLRRRRHILQVCLLGGTLLSIFAFLQVFMSIVLRYG